MKNIVWGTCWYNEPVETLIKFLSESITSLEEMGFSVKPIVFDARYIHNDEDLKLIKKEIPNATIILNKLNVFPNKNYGVALITNMAKKLEIENIAIVDPDWDILENNKFVQSIISELIDNDNDILIPNIKNASGRSNVLIGRTVIELFYPEYKNILKSVFPGAVAAKTKELYKIVNDKNYNFDWGGEWDIVAIGIKNKMKISSKEVEVKNIRHRSNTSKMQDSFQIWRAIYANDDILTRYNNLISFEPKNKKHRFYKLIKENSSIKEIIDIINNNNPTKTEKQILYMILYPLALITKDIKELEEISTKDKMPYNKKELYSIKELAIYCMKIALINGDIHKINKNAKTSKGTYFGKWREYPQDKALNESEVI